MDAGQDGQPRIRYWWKSEHDNPGMIKQHLFREKMWLVTQRNSKVRYMQNSWSFWYQRIAFWKCNIGQLTLLLLHPVLTGFTYLVPRYRTRYWPGVAYKIQTHNLLVTNLGPKLLPHWSNFETKAWICFAAPDLIELKVLLTLSPQTAKKSSLDGLPVTLSTVKGIGADDRR
jgi:hypothetical protein